MKIFIIGIPYSGRTTVAKAVLQDEKHQYIDASSWVKNTFRDQEPGEHIQKYLESYHEYLTKRIQANPLFAVNNVLDTIAAYNNTNVFIIDGINNPKDFVHLFDVNKDIVVFLNRTDNSEEFKDSESIAVSVIRDYCYWMSTAGLLSKDRWLEYNFKIPGEGVEVNLIKKMGTKNSVFISRSINNTITHLKKSLKELINPQDHQS
jgi:adenylate kinase family enzyme